MNKLFTCIEDVICSATNRFAAILVVVFFNRLCNQRKEDSYQLADRRRYADNHWLSLPESDSKGAWQRMDSMVHRRSAHYCRTLVLVWLSRIDSESRG